MIHRVTVIGAPIPQGSMKGFAVGKHVRMTSDNKRTRPWRADVAYAVREHVDVGGLAYERGTPVAVGVLYRFALPSRYIGARGVKVVTPLHPSTKPDRDKLDRAIGDALTAAGCVWYDDAQSAIGASAKVYVPPGEWTGALILVGDAEEDGAAVLSAVAQEVDAARLRLNEARAITPAQRAAQLGA